MIDSRAFKTPARVLSKLWKAFWNDAPKHLATAVANFLLTVESWLLDSKKATYGLAVTRMLFAVTALGLLASNFSTRFYTFGSGSAWTGEMAERRSGFIDIWLFSSFDRLIQNDVAFTLLYLLVAVLAVTLLVGYRVRLLLPVFWVLWVSLVELQDMVSDQGDNIFRIALFGMMFADSASRWSIDAKRRRKKVATRNVLVRLWKAAPVFPTQLVTMAHNLVIVTLTCQVIFVYVSGALYKAGGVPWQNGTAVYAPLHVTRFAPWPELSELATVWAPGVAIMTIGSVLVQLCFPGALLFRWTRIPILFAMISFHAGIGLLMGLPWFSLAMVAIDSIFVRDVTWGRIETWFKEAISAQPETSTPSIVEDDKSTDEKTEEHQGSPETTIRALETANR